MDGQPVPRPTRTAERILGALAILSLVIPAALLGAFAYASYGSHLEESRVQLRRMVDVVHEHALRVFDTFDLVSVQVAELSRDLDPAAGPDAEKPLHDRLSGLAKALPQVQDIWVLGEDGHPLVTANFYPAPRQLDLSDRAYFKAHVNRDAGIFVSEVLRGRAQQSAIFFQLSWRRVRAGGAFAGVTAVSVQPAYFRDFYSQLALGGLDSASLLREDGTVLARYPSDPAELVGMKPSTTFADAIRRDHDSGIYSAVSVFDGVERMIAYRRLPKHAVYVTAGMNLANLREAWRHSVERVAMIAVPVSLGLFCLSVLALRQTRREGLALVQLGDEANRRQKAEDALHQLQKMEAVGQLTGGVAHDFNNLLTVIVANLDRIERSPESSERVRRLAGAALAAAARGERLTQQLLAFARRQRLTPETADLNAMVRDIAPLIRRAVGEAVELRLALDPTIPSVTVDRTQFEASLLNLAVNARDAIGSGGGVLSIATSTVPGPRPPGAGTGQDEPWVGMVVSDTGSGIAPEIQSRVFEPFFTTKDVGKGSGLGLSQVYGFVSQSGGTIELQSTPGQGTRIIIALPPAGQATPAVRDEVAVPTGPAEPKGAGETILVVEDDSDVRAVAVEALSGLGCRVLVAADGPQALQILGGQQAIDLLFTDLVMPRGIDGEELARRAKRMRPGIGVLLTSGYAAGQADETGDRLPDPMLRKPYRSDELARAVAAALSTAPRPVRREEDDAAPVVRGERRVERRRVLVVEDDPLVLMSTADMLAEAGFEVAGEAETAEAALAMLRRSPDIDILFSDVGLPGMDGRRLASEARKLKPDIAVILATGHAAPGLSRAGPDLTLGKPFMVADLMRLRSELETI